MSKRNTSSRRKAKQQHKRQQQLMWIGGGVILAVVVLGIFYISSGGSNVTLSFPDIHGMSFTGDGEQLRVATHTGIVAYQDGNWSKPDIPINDYMGYSGTENGFFSSGHPGAGSNLVNPLGLIRSDDHGANITTINFLGETDFHVMGASYYGDTVYILNPAQNSLLSAGLHYSLDAGQTWEQSVANGLTASPMQITVHPTEDGVIAAATQGGVFFSNDYGENFTQIGDGGIATSVAFDPNGEQLLFGFDNLLSYSLTDGQITPLITSPQIATDQAILYIAINPLTDEIAFSTSDRDVFYSPDNGQSWEQIGENGASR